MLYYSFGALAVEFYVSIILMRISTAKYRDFISNIDVIAKLSL